MILRFYLTVEAARAIKTSADHALAKHVLESAYKVPTKANWHVEVEDPIDGEMRLLDEAATDDGDDLENPSAAKEDAEAAAFDEEIGERFAASLRV